MEKIYKNFHVKRWLDCDIGARRKFQYNDIAGTSADSNFGTIYPVYNEKSKMRRIISKEIYATDYINLLLSFYQAYEKCYRVNEIYKSMANNNNNATNEKPNQNTSKKWEESIQREENKQNTYKKHTFDYDKMEISLTRLEESLKKLGSKCPITKKQNNNKSKSAAGLNFNGILINESITIQYRNDIKYLLKLKTLLQDYNESYSGIFDEWLKVLEH